MAGAVSGWREPIAAGRNRSVIVRPDRPTVAESARAGSPAPLSLSTFAVNRVAERAVAQTRKSGAS